MFKLFISIFSLLLSVSSFAQELNTMNLERADLLRAKAIAWELATVKSNDMALESLNDPQSPFHMLSNEAKIKFIDSLVFTENGLGGFNYGILEYELTPTQIYKILTLVGAQHTVHLFKGARVETKADMLLLQDPLLFKTNEVKSSSTIDLGVSTTGDMPVFGDHADYACVGRATCQEEQGSICMSSC